MNGYFKGYFLYAGTLPLIILGELTTNGSVEDQIKIIEEAGSGTIGFEKGNLYIL